MNRTQIDYVDATWNPITGCLGPNGDGRRCPYCYAHKLAQGRLRKLYLENHNIIVGDPTDPFTPRFWRYREATPPLHIRKGGHIFVCDMGDLFGDWVERWMIIRILVLAEVWWECNYLFLTKNPQRLASFEFPGNAWVGTTITNQADAEKRIPELLKAKAKVKWLSVEPLLGPAALDLKGISWLVLGGLSPKPVHKAEWVEQILADADAGEWP